MSAYAEVDGVIHAFVERADTTLFTEWAKAPARYFHLPGDPPFECFQVSVRPPRNGRISVLVRAIDTNDDAELELERTLEGPVPELDEMLGAAVALIEMWKRRERKRPDPPSPW